MQADTSRRKRFTDLMKKCVDELAGRGTLPSPVVRNPELAMDLGVGVGWDACIDSDFGAEVGFSVC